MKFIAFYENSKEDTELMVKTGLQLRALREKEPNKLPKLLADYGLFTDLPKLTQPYKGFVLYDVDDPAQIANFLLHWHSVPTRKFYFIPIYESSKALELLMKK